MPDATTIRSAVEKYLSGLRTTLWADWEIQRPKRRALAVDWLTAQIEGVLAHLDPLVQDLGTIEPGTVLLVPSMDDAEPGFVQGLVEAVKNAAGHDQFLVAFDATGQTLLLDPERRHVFERTFAESALAIEARPCGCGLPLYGDEDDDEDLDDYQGPWCPHWCIVDVPSNEIRKGQVFAIRGDMPLEVGWHVALDDADPVTGAFSHKPVDRPQITSGPSTPHDPAQPVEVLQWRMIGRQNLRP